MESGGPSSTNHELSHQVSLHIDRLIQSVKKELEISYAFSDTCCIYKVPERLRELNEKAYTPRSVSIGPIHHGKEKLKAMEDHKRMYLQEFLAQSEVSVEGFIELIKEKETRLRHCYAETNGFSSECFIKMILMDAAFVIMFLLKCEYTDFRGSRDSIFYPPYKVYDVRVDICLLENQLPFFILEELYRLSNIFGNSPKPTLIELAHGFFTVSFGSWAVGDILEKVDFSEVKHLVDFLSIYHRPSTEQKQDAELEVLTVPSVKELHQAGVKFVLSSSKHLIDIKFDRSKGRLEIPRLKLVDSSEIIIRNLQAFEQCHGMKCRYVSDYISLMGLFLGASKDVEILVENRIIENWLTSNEEAVKLFYNLTRENILFQNDFLFTGLIKDLNAFCDRPWNRWKANLKQNYFNTPWAAISVSAAVILLILTVLQSVCSILQWTYTDFRESRDSIFYPPYKRFDVRVDICLLENQLPFFILQDLFGLSTIFGNSPKPTLIELTHGFFSNEWGSWAVGEYLGRVDFSGVKHLVEFLSIHHQPTEQNPKGKLDVLSSNRTQCKGAPPSGGQVCVEFKQTSSLFKGLVKDLNAFCERPWNKWKAKWKANLQQRYFNTSWAAVSVSGAAILLILTVIQAVCSILQVV